MKTPRRLTNAIQPYAWGSTTLMAEFLGLPNVTGKPQAELWIGAHPLLPSRLSDEDGPHRLDEWIREAPETVLGYAVSDKFGPELPFLLKVLAVAEPLSIQCHPNREQARSGFEREERAGVPRDAPERSYRDQNHKPELILALSRYTALKGFRPVQETGALLGSLGAPALAPSIEALTRAGDAGLAGFFSTLMSLGASDKSEVAEQASREARARRSSDPAWAWVARLSELYPADIGVLSPLYLNLIVLEPGQALYLPAGELHAHLEGLGIEIMANSDNVLRGGLTPKHVDLPELMRLLEFRAEPPQIVRPERRDDGARVYATPAEEFELALLRPSSEAPHPVAGDHGLEVLLVVDGRVRLSSAQTTLDLTRGDAVLVPAAADAYSLQGEARVARARVPR
jgi:mannose-6-phosphate isomerase